MFLFSEKWEISSPLFALFLLSYSLTCQAEECMPITTLTADEESLQWRAEPPS